MFEIMSLSPTPPTEKSHRASFNKSGRSIRSSAGDSSKITFQSTSDYHSAQSPIQKKPLGKLRSRYEKAHDALIELSKQSKALNLDYELREDVIQVLEEMDCLSDDDVGYREKSMDEDAVDRIFDLSASRSRRTKAVVKKPNFNKYDGITKQYLVQQIRVSRDRVRKKKIQRAVAEMIAKKQDQYQLAMLETLSEKNTAKNQLVRRIAIGWTNRLISKCKHVVAERIVRQDREQELRRELMLKSKSIILEVWRRYRLRTFRKGLKVMVDSHIKMINDDVLRKELSYRLRTAKRRVVEDMSVREWASKQATSPTFLPRLSATKQNCNQLELDEIERKEYVDYHKPDLAPFSQQITKRMDLLSTSMPKDVSWYDRAMVTSKYSDVIRRDPSKREESAAVRVLRHLLQQNDERILRSHRLAKVKNPLGFEPLGHDRAFI